MNQVGSTKDIISQSITGITDDSGNSVVSSSTGFGSSPLGVSARAQALYGIANPNFNLTPPDPDSAIEDQENPLPFWSIDNGSDGEMSATSVFDATTQTWGIELNPGTAAINSTLTLATRSYVLTDDNLALRQKALAVISKSGTAGGGTASQWNLTLSAIYYDATDTALSTAVIGTALDTGTWTSISGTTTPGGSAINSAAQYVDLSFKMTATAAVTGSAKATIKSLLLTTTSPTTGGGLLVTDIFTSSGTWTRPTGVEYVNVVAVGGGGGGGCGGGYGAANTNQSATGGGGGGGARWAYVPNVYVGDVGSVSIGVGSGGVGATTTPYTKTAGDSTENVQPTYGTAAAGGASTFGSYLSVPGGGAGGNGAGNSAAAARTGGTAGSAGTTITCSIYGNDSLASGAGGAGGGNAIGGTVTTSTGGVNGAGSAFTQLPFTSTSAIGSSGGSGTVTTGSSGTNSSTKAGGTSSNARISGGGGGGGAAGNAEPTTAAPTEYTGVGAAGAMNGGGGGGGATLTRTGALSFTVRGGAGGAGGLYGGGGGGGGGGNVSVDAALSEWTNSSGTFAGGVGGDGGIGVVIVSYVG